MAVNATHPLYDKYASRWCLVRNVVSSDVKRYIKEVDVSDPVRNERYRDDARFTNFTGRTKNGLVGMVFRKKIEINLPPAIDYIQEDATGNKMSISKVTQEILGEVLETGRYGLLVDYPASEEGLTAAQVAQLGLKARINKYDPESIINWQSNVSNGQYKLTLVVLKECISYLGDDGFSWQSAEQYRVLRLIDGTYIQQVYNEKYELISEYYPRDFSGAYWDHIPFIFIGSEDNDEDVDDAPLYDLAQLNIGHLRNSADYEESVYVCGQPTFVLSTTLSPEQFTAANPEGMVVGSRRGLNLGEGGSAQLLQANPNQLADEAMRRKEEQAIMIGARIVTPSNANETVDAVRLRSASETSVLDIVVMNVEVAMIQALIWLNKFMSSTEITAQDIVFNINNDFFETPVNPTVLIAQMQLLDRGVIAKHDLRQNMRKSGLIEPDRTDEIINADVGEINPLTGG